MNKEIWKDVIGYEGIYMVSNTGRVKSLDRLVNTGYGRKRLCKGIILRMALDKDGYSVKMLQNRGSKILKKVHRLVAIHFIPNPENKPEVNHLDGNKLNNNDWNLAWATTSENVQHSYDTKLKRPTVNTKETIAKNIEILRLANFHWIINIQTGIFYEGIKKAADSACMTESSLYAMLSGRNPNKTNFIKA